MNGFRRLVNYTIGATFLLILIGGVVRVSDSGLGCGPAGSGTHGWPLCGGRAVPFIETSAMIEYSHRIVAAAVAVLIVMIAWRAWRNFREHRFLVRGSLLAVALVLFQAALGGLTVEKNLDEELVAAHLVFAMLLLGVLLALSWAAREPATSSHNRPAGTASGFRRITVRPSGSLAEDSGGMMRGLRLLAVVTTTLVLATIAAGGYIAGTEKHGAEGAVQSGAHQACGKQFPGCIGEFMPFGRGQMVDIHLTHRVLMYLTAVALLALIALARIRRVRSRLLPLAGVVLAIQIGLGALNVWVGKSEWLIVAHLAVGTLLWATVVGAGLQLARVPAPSPGQLRRAGGETSAVPA